MLSICFTCKKSFITNRKKRKYCCHPCFLHSTTNTTKKRGENNVSKRKSVQKKMSKSALTRWKKGEVHYLWKGDKAGYSAIHIWIKSHYGKATICEYCNETGKKHRIEWANKDHNYLRKRKYWFQLCTPCHRKYDFDRMNNIDKSKFERRRKKQMKCAQSFRWKK